MRIRRAKGYIYIDNFMRIVQFGSLMRFAASSRCTIPLYTHMAFKKNLQRSLSSGIIKNVYINAIQRFKRKNQRVIVENVLN